MCAGIYSATICRIYGYILSLFFYSLKVVVLFFMMCFLERMAFSDYWVFSIIKKCRLFYTKFQLSKFPSNWVFLLYSFSMVNDFLISWHKIWVWLQHFLTLLSVVLVCQLFWSVNCFGLTFHVLVLNWWLILLNRFNYVIWLLALGVTKRKFGYIFLFVPCFLHIFEVTVVWKDFIQSHLFY